MRVALLAAEYFHQAPCPAAGKQGLTSAVGYRPPVSEDDCSSPLPSPSGPTQTASSYSSGELPRFGTQKVLVMANI